MATWTDAFSDNTDHDLELILTEDSVDSAGNTSSVTGRLQINPPSDSDSWDLYTSDNSYSFTFNGATYTGNFTYDFRTNRSTKVLKTVTSTVAHNADGTKSVTAYGSSATGTIGSASISTKTLTLTDITRLPSAPGSPTLSRNSAGTTITVVSAVASSAVTPSNYDLRYSTDNATWTTVAGIGTDRTGTFTGTATATYYVQTRAISSEGTGPWGPTTPASIVGIPGAPATITATRTGRNVTVTAGTSSGSGVTSYSVQYSSNGGSTWSSAVTMDGSRSYTYSSLTAGQSYIFRAYSTNSIGPSAYATSSTLFVPAGGRRYDGSTFTPTTTAKRWDGSAWVDITTAKRWTGSAWADLT